MIEYLIELGNFIATFWWVWIIIAVLMLGALGHHHHDIETAKQYERYGTPPDTTCPKSKMGHSWNTGGWNSGIYYHQAVGRTGHRCYHCGEMAYKHTDKEFVALQPAWMFQDPECKIPERFLQYIPKEVLDKREENIHNAHMDKLERKKQAAINTQKACTEELEELQSV